MSGIGRRFLQLSSRRYLATTKDAIPKREVVTAFDLKWPTLSEEEKKSLIKHYADVEKRDWHTLTVDEKRASMHSTTPFTDRFP